MNTTTADNQYLSLTSWRKPPSEGIAWFLVATAIWLTQILADDTRQNSPDAPAQDSARKSLSVELQRDWRVIEQRYPHLPLQQLHSNNEKALLILRANYRQALERRLEKPDLSDTGRIALASEVELLRSDRPVPDHDTPEVHPGIRQYRTTFRSSRKDILKSPDDWSQAQSRLRQVEKRWEAIDDWLRRAISRGAADHCAIPLQKRAQMEAQFALVWKWRQAQELAEASRVSPSATPAKDRLGMPVVINLREPQPGWQELAGSQIHQATGTFGEQLYLKKDGTLTGFGEGDVVRLIPPDLGPLKLIMARGGLAAGITIDGKVRMWGHRGVTTLMQDRMPSLSSVQDVQITGNMAAATLPNGSIKAWGEIDEFVTVLNRTRNVRAVRLGDHYGVVLKQTGRVEIIFDPQGKVTEEERRRVKRFENIVQVEISQFGTGPEALALTEEGKVLAWGWGPQFSEKPPVPEDLASDIDQVQIFSHGGRVGGAAHSQSEGWRFFGNEPVQLTTASQSAVKHAWNLSQIGDCWLALGTPPSATSSGLDHEGIAATHFVSPNGSGDTLTLDDALQRARSGDTLWLAPGLYPPSRLSSSLGAKLGSYAVTTSGISIRGHRSELPSDLLIPAHQVSVSGIRCRTIDVSGSRHCHLFRVVCRENFTGNADHLLLRNALIMGQCDFVNGENRHYENLTVLGRQGPHHFAGRPCVVANSIFLGNGPFLFSISNDSGGATLSRCLIGPAGALAVSESGPVTSRSDLLARGFKLDRCTFDSPIFVEPENGDYRLVEDSPGSSTRLGANLAPDGWPDSDRVEQLAINR